MMLVQDFLTTSAERFPDKTALICTEKRYTYANLNEQSRRLAWALRAMGLRRQDRVVIFCENSLECVVALFGTLMAGGIFVMLNPAMKAKKLTFILNHSGARAVIAQTNKASILREALADAPDVKHLVWTGPIKAEPPRRASDAKEYLWQALLEDAAHVRQGPGSAGIDVDLATIIYTSGSTGEPKGVMSAHCNMVAAARSITTYLENTPEDIILNTLPLSFDYGLYQLLMTFMFGGTLVLEPSFAFPYKVLERLAREKVTGFPIVPTMAALLLQMQDLSKFDFSSLRYISNTAAALPVPHIRRLIELFPTVRIYSMYGLTECKRVAYMPPEKLAQRPASVGIAMPNCEVFVVDEEGRETEPDQVGELVIRGANVMQGYWNSPEETAKRFRPGRYRGDVLLYSGDLFRRDKEGFLYFVGRRDDMIKTKGERVSPKEIENVICELTGVAEAAVIGVPDEILGQAVKAILVLSDNAILSKNKVLNHCRQNLEPFMVPKHIEFRDALPKTSTGKIDKKPLK
jgi:amino acid adenylation domain-containing protein